MVKKIVNRVLSRFGYTLARSKKSEQGFQKDEIAFLHIGKNSGTQIMHCAKLLKEHGVKIRKFGHGIKLNQIPEDAPYFFSIRNPASRFKSGFYSRKRKGAPRTYSEWSRHEELTFARFEHANDLAEALFSEGEKGREAAMAIKSISHTGMQQIDWFQRAAFINDRPPIWIIRQEFFEADLDRFLNNLKLPLKASDIVTTDNVKSHANDYSGIPALSDLAVENLRKWYVQDYLFYDICENWIKQNTKD